MRTPWGTSTALVSSLSIAIAEVTTPAVGVAKAHEVHQALDGAVLAGGPVERVEDDVWLQLGEARGDVAVHVELGDFGPAAFPQCFRGALAAGQRDLALLRPAAHQDYDVKRLVHYFAVPGEGRGPVLAGRGWISAFAE